MSIKRYLFILIGGIVLTVAVVQILLIAFFKQHLNQEIIEKSQQLSTRIIDFAVEHVNVENDEVFVLNTQKGESNQTVPTKVIAKYQNLDMLNGDCTVTKTNDSPQNTTNEDTIITSTVKVNCKDAVSVFNFNTDNNSNNNAQNRVISAEELKQEKLRWKKQLHKIIEERHKGQQVVQEFSFIAKNTNHNPLMERHLLEDSSAQSTAINTLVDYMIYLILASSIVALILAFWLSNHFTRPLQKLSSGFQSLEKGDFGVQVQVSGINEYRKTIHSFNQMSQRLAQLAEREKVMQQQGHLAELGEVSRGLAHALRNPMHTIGLSVEQLKDTSLPEPLRTKLQDKIQNKIKHIDKTIKALLTLTSGEIQRNDEVPVRSVIQDIILEMKANGPNVNIQFNAPQSNTTIKGAESEIRAIIHTLIVNAIEANENQGCVEIQLQENEQQILVTVLDQGKGIEKRIADKIFQPHVSTKTEGAGMGLYISRRLATLYYNGDITLSQRDIGGCRAMVTLQKEN